MNFSMWRCIVAVRWVHGGRNEISLKAVKNGKATRANEILLKFLKKLRS